VRSSGLSTPMAPTSRPQSLCDPARAVYYIPEAQTVQFDQPDLQSDELWSQNLYNIVIWAPGHPANILTQVKKALAEVEPNLVIYDV